MTAHTIVLYLFAALAACSAIGVLVLRNVFKAALSLLCCLLALAAIYVLSFAEFVAVAQILVYAGGVVVLILFGIMLTNKMSGKPLVVGFNNVITGSMLVIGLTAGLWTMVGNLTPTSPVHPTGKAEENIEWVGTSLMTTYALPFEVTGVILLLALIGAAVSTINKNNNESAS